MWWTMASNNMQMLLKGYISKQYIFLIWNIKIKLIFL